MNFDDDFAKVDNCNVFPLLGRYDQIIKFERQKQCYDENLITVLEKEHITASLTYEKVLAHRSEA